LSDDQVGARLGRSAARLAGVAVIGAAMVSAVMVVGGPTAAFADTPPYELICPGTPVGTAILNDTTTTGTMTPASPTAGQTFNLTNVQTHTALTTQLAQAAFAFGTSLAGSSTQTFDATGATPASIPVGPTNFSEPIPQPIPSTGMALLVPASPATVGPFTATGSSVQVKVDPKVALTLIVAGSPLPLTCSVVANNSNPTGLVPSTKTPAPTGPSVSPLIASSGSGAATTAPAATPTTVPAPATSPSASPPPLAYTGAGPGLFLMGVVGIAALILGGTLLVAQRARRLLVRVSHRSPGNRSDTG